MKNSRRAALIFASLAIILLEVQLSALCNFAYEDGVNILIPVIFFLALSVGNILGMTKWIQPVPLAVILLVCSGLAAAAFLGLSLARETGLIWISLPFVSFGVFYARVFSEVSIRDILIAMSVAGVVAYAMVNPAQRLLGGHAVTLALGTCLMSAVLWNFTLSRLTWLAGGLVVIGTIQIFNLTEVKSRIESYYQRFEGAQRLIPPILGPLIRTDLLYLPAIEQNVMVMNGSRWAVIPSNLRVENAYKGKTAEFRPSYDAPYLYGKPKKVLVIGPAEGQNILSAIKFGASEIWAVDINPAVFEILRGPMREQTRGFIDDPRVRTVVSEGRHFLEKTQEKFDLITQQGIQTASQSGTLNTAFLESFLFTEEALKILWDRLSDDGMIFFDEYRSFDRSRRESSVLEVLGIGSQNVLPFKNFPTQHVFYTYAQESGNPGSSEAMQSFRDGLIISKKPLYTDRPGLLRRKNLEGIPAKYETITDDRPFFLQAMFAGVRPRMLEFTILAWLFLAAGAGWTSRKSPGARSNYALFLVGIGYIQMVMALYGPLTLLLGEVSYVTPVLLCSLYAFSLPSGLWALGLKNPRTGLWMFVAGAGLLLMPLLLGRLKFAMLGPLSLGENLFISVLLVGGLAVAPEIPYILMLKPLEGRSRGWGYTYENLGTLAGVFLAIPMQFLFGFSGGLMGSALCYFLAGAQFLRKS